MQNHVIDPTFFFDAIEEFSFDYTLFVVKARAVDDLTGKIKTQYTSTTVRGSLQSHGTSLVQSIEGNTTETKYNFYCKSLYRINIGDVIKYKNKYLMVISVNDYDEFGCRSCELAQIQLTAYRDLEEYIKYQTGVMII